MSAQGRLLCRCVSVRREHFAGHSTAVAFTSRHAGTDLLKVHGTWYNANEITKNEDALVDADQVDKKNECQRGQWQIKHRDNGVAKGEDKTQSASKQRNRGIHTIHCISMARPSIAVFPEVRLLSFSSRKNAVKEKERARPCGSTARGCACVREGSRHSRQGKAGRLEAWLEIRNHRGGAKAAIRFAVPSGGGGM